MALVRAQRPLIWDHVPLFEGRRRLGLAFLSGISLRAGSAVRILYKFDVHLLLLCYVIVTIIYNSDTELLNTKDSEPADACVGCVAPKLALNTCKHLNVLLRVFLRRM